MKLKKNIFILCTSKMWKSYFEDCEAVIAEVKKYLESSNKGKSSIMAPNFHKDAVIFEGNQPEEGNHAIKGFFDLIDSVGQDPNHNPPSHISILDITETTAVTKTVMVFHRQAYTDYHAFVKTTKGWKIAAKIYHTIK